MFSYMSLILTLAFTLAGDALFSVAIIWQVLAKGGSSKILALFLCLIMILIFILQKCSIKLRKELEKNPRRSFTFARIAGIGCSIIFLPLIWHQSITMLYLAGMVFAIISFFSTLSVEAIMGQEVLQHRLTSNQASRILQTAMQISFFLGASLAGFVLNHGGMFGVLIINIATYSSGALIFYLLLNASNLDSNNLTIKTNSELASHVTKLPILWIIFIGLTFLMMQITSFNFLVPQIAQLEKSWTATQFGLIDAAAGLGAFLCTFVTIEKGPWSKLWIFSFVSIFITDIAFHFVNNTYLMLVIVFMLGFFVNCFRIKLRAFMYDAVSNVHELYEWTGRITVMTSVVKAVLPLCLAFIVLEPSIIFMLVGTIFSFCIFLTEMTYYFAKKKEKKLIEQIDFTLNISNQFE